MNQVQDKTLDYSRMSPTIMSETSYKEKLQSLNLTDYLMIGTIRSQFMKELEKVEYELVPLKKGDHLHSLLLGRKISIEETLSVIKRFEIECQEKRDVTFIQVCMDYFKHQPFALQAMFEETERRMTNHAPQRWSNIHRKFI